jgi:hypothetical protein
VFGFFNAYDLATSKPAQAQVTVGNSAHPFVGLMKAMLANAPIVAVQTFQSQPVVAESSLYYVDL